MRHPDSMVTLHQEQFPDSNGGMRVTQVNALVCTMFGNAQGIYSRLMGHHASKSFENGWGEKVVCAIYLQIFHMFEVI